MAATWEEKGESEPQVCLQHGDTAPSLVTHKEEEAGVPREEGSVATLGQMVAQWGCTSPTGIRREQHGKAWRLTSRAAMPAATPPTTSAFVLISSRI